MLTSYLQQTSRLLNDSANSIFSVSDLTTYINIARQDIALEGEAIRVFVTQQMTSGVSSYSFSGFVIPIDSIASVVVVRQVFLQSPGTRAMLQPRSWEWFTSYYYPQLPGATGVPTMWAQQGQGSSGTIWFFENPNSSSIIMALDAVCIPASLITDNSLEALPFPWVTAVPYYAAYLAYTFAQRAGDADKMWNFYEIFVRRARQLSTATLLPGNYPGGDGAKMADGKLSLATPVKG